ncbi:ABC transporter permease [Microbispora catharanthi]|uniref:FtsX-like permease family protein n=1 Tax=Microbispora catharanthi TaxID=1712871 RepID=A0A5N6BJQ6_9ACTN|nr:ABC transporter permease [Microbispora catharanthi]KAB8180645.1 FtsX-like permease family protein [Microbispora catharanthi]
MRSRLLPRDVLRTGAAGLRARPGRMALAALGIAIGIAAMVCVVGVTASSTENLNRRLAVLGTNLLTVAPGASMDGAPTHLPPEAPMMIAGIPAVTAVTATGTVTASAYRSDLIPPIQTGSLAVLAARPDLPDTLRTTLARGAFLNAATARFPVTVLGSAAAVRLNVVAPGEQVWLGGHWFTVTGILTPTPLAPELDSAALIGWDVAERLLRFDGHPTTVYVRTYDATVESVRAILAGTADPETPDEVQVSRPSDALIAKRAAGDTLTALLLSLGAVALLVGGVGVANTMIVSVLERRSEIGLRRSLGATRRHIRLQFLAESLTLSGAGGLAGVLFGAALASAYALHEGWPVVIPLWAAGTGLAAAMLIGGVAGGYPAWRAARVSPTEALR